MPDTRTELVIVAGLPAGAVREVVDAFVRDSPGTVAIHHALDHLARGTVTRRLRKGTEDTVTAVDLAHGCVSCTLREDLLPLLADQAATPDVDRIVLHLDPALEPESICWALRHVVLADATVAELVRIEAVITVLDAGTWLASATGDDDLTDHGLALTPDDDRTLAQVAVGQVEFADAVVLAGSAGDGWTSARTSAVLDRLAPGAPRTGLLTFDPNELLAAVPAHGRRGRDDDPHGPVLLGQPPLEQDCGCSVTLFSARRPFHPQRLHVAIDSLVTGVVRSRGRIWLASRPDTVLWLESAGGGLRIGRIGPWLACDESAWDVVSPQRRAMAALRWDPYYGDRAQDLTVLSYAGDPDTITSALEAALLTDEELSLGYQEWQSWADPFADWRTVIEEGQS
jgi:G3E family GTPase